MSISETNSVDIMVTTKTGEVLLVVADHLEWDNEEEHLALLQKKLNTYIHVLKSGSIFQGHEELRGKKFVIQVDFRCAPTPGAIAYIDRIRPIVKSYGYEDLRYEDCSEE